VFTARAIPQWIGGPTALGNPLAWLPAAALTFTPGTPTWVCALIMGLGVASVVLSALGARRAGPATPPYRINALTGMWMAALLLLWTVLTGIAHGSSADAGADAKTAPVVVAPVDVAPAEAAPDPALRPIFRLYELSEVDVQPALVNREEVDRKLSSSYPLLLRDAGVTGTVIVAFTVDTLGVPDPASMSVQSSTHQAFTAAAIAVARVMRFSPATKDGGAVQVRLTLPVTFALQ
jgi:TonB family protein